MEQLVLQAPKFVDSETMIKRLTEDTNTILARIAQFNQSAKQIQETINSCKRGLLSPEKAKK